MISWDEAVALIEGGRIVGVAQTHNLKVTLYDDENNTYVTKEPAIDAVIRVINQLPKELREKIAIRTE